MSLLRRLPPSGIASNFDLMDYLMNRSAQKEKTSLVRQIITSSTDGILCLNQVGIIDSVNPAVCHILKCTPCTLR